MDQLLDEEIIPVKTFRPAGFWIRVLASILDFLALIIPALILAWIFGFGNGVGLYQSLIVLILYALYEIYMVSRHQGTLGKLVLNLSVLNEDGARLSIGQSFGRYAIKYGALSLLNLITDYAFDLGLINSPILFVISMIQILLVLFCLASYISVAFMPEKRGFHDRLAKTRVVYHKN